MSGPTYEEIYHFLKMMEATRDPDDAVALAAIRAANRWMIPFGVEWESLLTSEDRDLSDWPVYHDLRRKVVDLLQVAHLLSGDDLAELDRMAFLLRFQRLTGEQVLRLTNMHMRAAR